MYIQHPSCRRLWIHFLGQQTLFAVRMLLRLRLPLRCWCYYSCRYYFSFLCYLCSPPNPKVFKRPSHSCDCKLMLLRPLRLPRVHNCFLPLRLCCRCSIFNTSVMLLLAVLLLLFLPQRYPQRGRGLHTCSKGVLMLGAVLRVKVFSLHSFCSGMLNLYSPP